MTRSEPGSLVEGLCPLERTYGENEYSSVALVQEVANALYLEQEGV
jgi:hypothetical protein